jgi:hypothetical protein
MGPSAWHVDLAELETRIAALPEYLEVTASVHVGTYLVREQ